VLAVVPRPPLVAQEAQDPAPNKTAAPEKIAEVNELAKKLASMRDGDPEALLVLETSKEGWQYMIGRMTGNPMSYTFDGKKIPVELPRSATGAYIFVRRQAE
jgi:hypothetical protein